MFPSTGDRISMENNKSREKREEKTNWKRSHLQMRNTAPMAQLHNTPDRRKKKQNKSQGIKISHVYSLIYSNDCILYFDSNLVSSFRFLQIQLILRYFMLFFFAIFVPYNIVNVFSLLLLGYLYVGARHRIRFFCFMQTFHLNQMIYRVFLLFCHFNSLFS